MIIYCNKKENGIGIHHANARGTGSAMRVELVPAHNGEQGCITLRLAPQETAQPIAFNWDAVVTAELGLFDTAKMIEVFRGCSESINDGKGIFRRSETGCTVVQVAFRGETVPGYSVEITKKSKVGIRKVGIRKVGIRLTMGEAFALSLALEGAMGRIAFG